MSPAIISFVALVALTLGITTWAAYQGSSRADMYVADRKIGAWKNGLAIVGDLLSANTLLGTVALFYVGGSAAILFILPGTVGLVLAMIWLSAPLRRLGRFTLGDTLSACLPSPSLKIYSGMSTILISLVYLIAQMVAAGALISLLFGISFEVSAGVIGLLTAIYIAFGGMLAATWVQMVKAVLMIAAIVVLSALSLVESGGLASLYDSAAAVHTTGAKLFSFNGLGLDTLSSVSLAVGTAFGIMGLPHLLIRSLTVKDTESSTRSMAIASILCAGISAAIVFLLFPAGVAFVGAAQEFRDAGGAIKGGVNMIVVHLASALGGDVLFGMISAVAFSTILAVVTGLIIATATAISHDIYGLFRPQGGERSEVLVFRISTLVIAAAASGLAVLFQHENVTILATLALTIAASANFPVLVLALYWKRLSVAGALAGGLTGLVLSVGLIILGPTVWVRALGHAEPIFPTDYPTLLAAPMAFAMAWLVSTIGASMKQAD